jgi:Protein of unknown function (DUF4019)
MRLEEKRKLFPIMIAVLLFTSSGCGLTKGKANAEAAVKHFHDQFNVGQFSAMYGEASDEFKKATSEADFTALLQAVHRKLGTVKQSNPAGWGVNVTSMGTMATLSYEVEFSDAKGTETFVFRISDNKARLVNYNINSADLITK